MAIARVMNFRLEAKWACSSVTVERGHLTAFHFYQTAYLEELKKAPALQNCSADFATAWHEYVSAVGDWVSKNSSAGWINFEKFAPPANSYFMPPAIMPLMDKAEPDETMPAFKKVLEIDKNHGFGA
jgi:hypothetical protein